MALGREGEVFVELFNGSNRRRCVGDPTEEVTGVEWKIGQDYGRDDERY